MHVPSNLSHSFKVQRKSLLLCHNFHECFFFFPFLQNFQPNVTLGPELTNSVQLQVKTVDSTVEAGAQFQQMVNIECTTDFTAQPDLNVNFTCNGKGHKVPLKIPISVNKFMEPTEMDGNNFFARWKNLSM